MNKKLETKLKNIDKKEIDFFDLRDYICLNKDLKTNNQIRNALEWLNNSGVTVINTPKLTEDLVNIKRAKKQTAKKKIEKKVEKKTEEEPLIIESTEDFEDDEFEEPLSYKEMEELEKEVSGDIYVDPDTTYTNFDIAKLYIKDIVTLNKPLLTREQEFELFERLRNNNDEEAKREIIESNLKLVINCAKKFSPDASILDFLDLIQEGNLGLMLAIDKFDHTLGFKFSTYSVYWIRQNIMRAMSCNTRSMRLPVHVVDQALAIIRARSILQNQTGKQEISFEDIAKYCNEHNMNRNSKRLDGTKPPLTAEQAKTYLFAYTTDMVSLDTPCGEDGDNTVVDLIEDTDAVCPDEHGLNLALRDQLEKAMNAKLDTRCRVILKLRCGWDDGIPRSLGYIANIFGLTRERIRQLEEDSLIKLSKLSYLQGPYMKPRQKKRVWKNGI